MLESIIKFREIREKPWLIFLWALLIASVGILFSIQLSYHIYISGNVIQLTGLFSVLFTIIPSVFFLTMYIKTEERMDEKDIESHYKKGFWDRHDKDMMVFLLYFAGLTLAFALWAFVLPAGTFQIQTMKITEIRALSGTFLGTGNLLESGSLVEGFAGTTGNFFLDILLNNLQVLAFAFIFSLLFGAGAVFIVVWNASILGVYIGRLSESILHIPGVSLSFIPHGIPEIGGYLLAGLAGGIISAAIIRGHKKEVILSVCVDALKLLGLGAVFILLGALIEAMDFSIRMVSIFIFYTLFIYILTKALSPCKNENA
jgi:uncharacterized membrane protein SpoIIM required for sporulation